jgi:membrane dipeptidase
MSPEPLRDFPSVYGREIVWDAHTCLPLKFGLDMAAIERHRAAGATFVSVNVGMDFNPLAQVVRIIAGFRDWLLRHADNYILAGTVADVHRAKREGKLAVAFDLEGSVMLEDDLAMVRLFSDLGVRQIHLAYNRDNSVAGGCHGADRGLTPLGRQVVTRINESGMLMDCSHTGLSSSLEIMEISTKPVIFSHSNIRALRDHPRNITDAQIDACARTGGVVGLCGIGLFMGANDISTETLIRHIDYVVQRVGIAHAGLGLDFVFDPDHEDLPKDQKAEDWWPRADGYGLPGMQKVEPERLPRIAEALLQRGYTEGDVAAIIGGNFLRVAGETWPTEAAFQPRAT